MTEGQIGAEADPALGKHWTAAAHLEQMFLLNAGAGVAHTVYHHGLVEDGRPMPVTAAGLAVAGMIGDRSPGPPPPRRDAAGALRAGPRLCLPSRA